MNHKWYVIINPTSGNNRYKKRVSKLLALLSSHNIKHEYKLTKYAKQEYVLVQNAIKLGYRKIISVGGDGTLHHIVNGIIHQNDVKSNELKVAVIPTGTGNDWVKTYGITSNILKNIELIKQEKTILQDIGKVTLENQKKPIYFNNLTGIGFDGHVVNYINKYKKLKSLAYIVGALIGFSTYKSSEFKIAFNNQEIITKSLMTLIGLCNYSGGGMKLTKNPNSTDGLLDISIIKDINIGNVLLNILKLYNGKIVHHKKVTTYKTDKITIDINDATKPFIQSDGELISSSNFEISIISKAIQFVIS